MKLTFLLSFFLAAAQGAVTYTPPVPAQTATPGKVVMAAGALTCTVTGDAVPAQALAITCTGAITTSAILIPLPTGANFTFVLGLNGDSVAILFSHTNTVSFQATVTSAGTTSPVTTGTL
jgi:hypothetical protein